VRLLFRVRVGIRAIVSGVRVGLLKTELIVTVSLG